MVTGRRLVGWLSAGPRPLSRSILVARHLRDKRATNEIGADHHSSPDVRDAAIERRLRKPDGSPSNITSVSTRADGMRVKRPRHGSAHAASARALQYSGEMIAPS